MNELPIMDSQKLPKPLPQSQPTILDLWKPGECQHCHKYNLVYNNGKGLTCVACLFEDSPWPTRIVTHKEIMKQLFDNYCHQCSQYASLKEIKILLDTDIESQGCDIVGTICSKYHAVTIYGWPKYACTKYTRLSNKKVSSDNKVSGEDVKVASES